MVWGMTTSNQWQAFYDDHAPYYDLGAFTHHTVAEVDFLVARSTCPLARASWTLAAVPVVTPSNWRAADSPLPGWTFRRAC